MKATKSEVKKLLQDRRFDDLCRLETERGGVFRWLRSLACDREELVFWRAVEAIGPFSRFVAAQQGIDAMRGMVRRLNWALSDESGDMAWAGPEMLVEIFMANPKTCRDVAFIVINLDELIFRRNAVWAAGRIATEHPDIVRDVADELLAELDNADPEIRAYAAWALGLIKDGRAAGKLKALAGDSDGPVKFYRNGELERVTVGDLARESLAGML